MKLFIRLFQSWWYKLFPCIFHVFPIRILALEENFLLQFRMDVSFFFMLLFHKFCNWINIRLKSMIKSKFLFNFFPSSRLVPCSSKACSKDERKRDFEKIFNHYDVVSTIIQWVNERRSFPDMFSTLFISTFWKKIWEYCCKTLCGTSDTWSLHLLHL